MTLILAAITRDVVVVSADGAEFTHHKNRPKELTVSDRQKLFAITGRPWILAVHGQNRLVAPGSPIAAQRLVGDLIAENEALFAASETVEQVTRVVFETFSPYVLHTFPMLIDRGIHGSALRIAVFGFDAAKAPGICWEAVWPKLDESQVPHVIQRAPKLGKPVTIFHGGVGDRYVIQAINFPGERFHPNRIKNAKLPADIQKYVRRLYKQASEYQQNDPKEFDGHYHEATITPQECIWSKLPASNSPPAIE